MAFSRKWIQDYAKIWAWHVDSTFCTNNHYATHRGITLNTNQYSNKKTKKKQLFTWSLISCSCCCNFWISRDKSLEPLFMTPLGWGAGGAKNRHTHKSSAKKKQYRWNDLPIQTKKELKFAQQFIVH